VLPAAETFTGIDKGVVDAADFSTYTMNESVGFQKVAKYPIYPGIHSMPVIQFTVNKAAYEALSPAHKTILDVWYRAMIDDLRMRNEVSDREIVARDKAAGVEVIDWPQAERDKFRTIAEAAWKDYAQAIRWCRRPTRPRSPSCGGSACSSGNDRPTFPSRRPAGGSGGRRLAPEEEGTACAGSTASTRSWARVSPGSISRRWR
jgi:hypothetical protein